jgi:hypothetical protein
MANPRTGPRMMNTNLVDMLTGTQQGWFCTVSTASQVNNFFIYNEFFINF